MELLVGIVVLLALVFCLTGELGAVITAFAWIVVLFSFALLGFFVYFLCSMLRGEKRTARFVRFGKSGRDGFERAVYEIGGEEFSSVFPAEPLFRPRLYRAEQSVPVRFSAKKGRLYDRWTCVTIWLGTAAFLTLSPLLLWGMLGLTRLLP